MPKLEYEEVDWGIRQIATRSADNVRVSDWTFPNRNHVVSAGLTRDDPWSETFAWALAQDDENELRLGVQFSPVQGDAAKRYEETLLKNGYEPTGNPNEFYARHGYDPGRHRDELFISRVIPESGSGLTNAQDYVAQAGQGVIADRSQERLGRSDAGVIFLRRLFLRELAAIRDGRPTKAWRRGGETIPMPLQPWEHGREEQGWDRRGVTSAPMAR
jgi:5,5'-dehydrodivanillate O-demethylase